ncbi:MAG TPA: substrate-binding domain-containing protein [Roseiflexaceae bacterium]|nr:substrate-binding domain-containing protein [Roseiflexaceae bacterium]
MQRLTRLIGIGYLAICLLALLATTFVAPLGYAPFPLQIGPAREPVVLTVWYGTEKRAWLEEAAARFAQGDPRVGGRPVRVVLRGIGSREQAERVASQRWGGEPPPAVISPASSMWLEVLRGAWAARNPGAPPVLPEGADAPAPLALTPLVLVAWEERGPLIWRGEEGFWQELAGALARRNWSELGGREEWGPVKLGHTSPLTSNSGAQALVLLAYGYHGKAAGLTIADVSSAGFRAWLAGVESAVPAFSDSTGALVTSMLQRGPSMYDAAVVYENLAIESFEAARAWGGLRVYYPPATALSDHPYAILNAPWVTPAEREAARQFRAFLLSRPIQERARAHGFRPADPGVPIVSDDPANPFNRYQANGLRADIQQQAEPPTADVLAALLDLWQELR